MGKCMDEGWRNKSPDITAYTFAVLALTQVKVDQPLNGKVDLAFTFDKKRAVTEDKMAIGSRVYQARPSNCRWFYIFCRKCS